MSKNNLLEKYKEKRDFSKTPEPENNGPITEGNLFVIQKHAASRLHYDFRLEINGVLKSWAVPKGPSTDPEVKRLAVETEDHPLSYANFEGVIPKGEYGAGPVIIWDTGTYTDINKKDGKLISMEESYKNGHIVINLHGHKLKGGWALIQAKIAGKPKNWLLVKEKDEYANKPENPESLDKSVVSEKTLEQVREDYESKNK